jgi:NADPH:quinone reductase-like Zn-dependent oxidoreductase
MRKADVETLARGKHHGSYRKSRPLVTIVDRLDTALAAKAGQAGFRFAGISVEPDHQGLEELTRLVEDGKIKVHVERTSPLERIVAAHEFLATNPKGKVVLTA